MGSCLLCQSQKTSVITSPNGSSLFLQLCSGEKLWSNSVTAVPSLVQHCIARSGVMAGSVQTYPLREVITVFLSHAGKILVLKRSTRVGTYQGHWSGVSGYLERTDPLDQAYTEIAEEVGLSSDQVV